MLEMDRLKRTKKKCFYVEIDKTGEKKRKNRSFFIQLSLPPWLDTEEETQKKNNEYKYETLGYVITVLDKQPHKNILGLEK